MERDVRWEKVWASMGWEYDIDENIQWYKIRIEVIWNDMVWYSTQTLDAQSADEFVGLDEGISELIPSLLDAMVESIDGYIAERLSLPNRHTICHEMRATKDGRIISQGAVTWPETAQIPVTMGFYRDDLDSLIGYATDIRREADLRITALITITRPEDLRENFAKDYEAACELEDISVKDEDGLMVIEKGEVRSVSFVPKQYSSWKD